MISLTGDNWDYPMSWYFYHFFWLRLSCIPDPNSTHLCWCSDKVSRYIVHPTQITDSVRLWFKIHFALDFILPKKFQFTFFKKSKEHIFTRIPRKIYNFVFNLRSTLDVCSIVIFNLFFLKIIKIDGSLFSAYQDFRWLSWMPLDGCSISSDWYSINRWIWI